MSGSRRSPAEPVRLSARLPGPRVHVALATCLVLTWVGLAACSGDSGPDGPAPGPSSRPAAGESPAGTPSEQAVAGVEYARAKKVLDRHQESIWRYPGVQGMGIEGAPGAEDGGREPSPEPLFRIVVHVDTRADVPDAPRSVEGVPLRFTVSGEFTAQPAPAG